ncbi:HAD family hydrolase [Deinococcus hopiensis]|uniref:Putative hydrolase of the HAD superfamily n=1 Tax=Deinococcus hopiensis KR-140 TaxID=695939 RepID=A0A1W1VGL6_9DEIO|nr:HAD family phosphatase [Deinococcus hopiensis]SMB92498.1 putative hydrolase of the HAD superfamily [Deinococcus hopiensis KR-140]
MRLPDHPSALRAVLFDRDGTIATTDREVYREAAGWLGARTGLDTRSISQTLLAHWQERAEGWREVRSEADEEAFWAAYMDALAQRLKLGRAHAAALLENFPYERYLKAVPDAREVLSRLRARGLKIGVLSNTFPSIDRTLAATGLADLVDVAVASCAVGVHKPDAGAFGAALERLGLPAEAVLFVDDLPENVEAARALGMAAVRIDLTGQAGNAIHSLGALLPMLDGPA